MEKSIYALSLAEVFGKLECSKEGLTDVEASLRLSRYGKNALKHKKRLAAWRIFFRQLDSALVWILLVAALLALVFGEKRDFGIIMAIVAVNALIGFFQEYRAERTLESIRKLSADRAVVKRGGMRREIDSKYLVTGDIVMLSAGDNVPADGILVEGYDVYANEFIFTGESKPTKKKVCAEGLEREVPLSERCNMLHMGTALTRGEATVLVSSTGMRTELGKIADMVAEVEDEETPLQKQMRLLGKDVTVLSLMIAVLVLVAGISQGIGWYETFLFALALSVSVVPEGLPAAISVALSLGMRRLLKENVLAKKLNAVETLSSVSIICTDKTGTITRNELMVTSLATAEGEFALTGEGYDIKGDFLQFGRKINPEDFSAIKECMRVASLCSEATLRQEKGFWQITGDPTEGALVVASRKYAEKEDYFSKGFVKLGMIPFSSERMRMSVVFKEEATGRAFSYVKGSPDVLLERCSHVLSGSEIKEFTPQEKEKARRIYDSYSSRALRVLALAKREIGNFGKNGWEEEAENGLVWLGMAGMIDPPRADVAEAIAQCRSGGIKVVMITGDYEKTAEAIARSVGMLSTDNCRIINGRQLDIISDTDLLEIIRKKEVVFARIAPEQKLRIARVLVDSGAVIAMTGDGVNDAPALKKASIGIAMGKIGSDVAKEAADMILLDDNFASIVRVVREGRTVYQNLRKFVYYVFTSNASEFMTVVIGVLLGLPAPITAVQILAIDLGTDIFPSFSLSLEKPEPGVMRQNPFAPAAKVLTARGFWRLMRVGLLMASGAVAAFVVIMIGGGWEFGKEIDPSSVLYAKSTTAAYTVLALSQMANLLAARSEKLSVFALGFFSNRAAIYAICASVGILVAFIYVPQISSLLGLYPIGLREWMLALGVTVAVFLYEEARKANGKNASL